MKFNLKEIISSIADVGQKLFKKTELKKNDLQTILSLCDDLISNKGAAFGITVARDITDLYQTLTLENKLLVFQKINEKYKPNHTKVTEAIETYQKTQKDKKEKKRRLGEDRRFFSYFHPALEDEPIIFVQVALTNGLGKSIQEITKPRTEGDINYDSATFYSISNCQEGLSRVTLGNFLIKRVVYEIQEELPNIKYFGTLSPIPGFRDWF